eukprot:6342407-Amphidinium_carterae.1
MVNGAKCRVTQWHFQYDGAQIISQHQLGWPNGYGVSLLRMRLSTASIIDRNITEVATVQCCPPIFAGRRAHGFGPRHLVRSVVEHVWISRWRCTSM